MDVARTQAQRSNRRLRFLPAADRSALVWVLTIVLVLEATRRTTGWILPVVALVFLAYAWLGAWLPSPWTHQGYPYFSGRAIYRKHFELPESFANQRVFLEPQMEDLADTFAADSRAFTGRAQAEALERSLDAAGSRLRAVSRARRMRADSTCSC